MACTAAGRLFAYGASIVVASVIGGCSYSPDARETSSLELPTIATGTLYDARSMDWFRDTCGDGRFTTRSDDMLGHGSCLPHGGEVYRVRLRNGRDYAGRALPNNIAVALNGHALSTDLSIQGKYFVLQPSPLAMQEATGIALYVAVLGGFDASRRCFDGGWMPGRAHMDLQQCPDRDFRTRNLNRCIPVQEFLEHHREKRH
jgi:hypothetical protein